MTAEATSRREAARRTILLVEDEALIAMDERAKLERLGYRVTVTGKPEAAVREGQNPAIDLILMDIDLGDPAMDGTRVAERILSEREVPIVFLTSHQEREMVERVRGITRYGYVLKSAGEFVLSQSIEMALDLFDAHVAMEQEIEQRCRAEAAAVQNEALFRNLMENSIDAVYLMDEVGTMLDANQVATEMLGYTREELLALTIDDIDPNYPSKAFVAFWREKPEGTSLLFETRHRRSDGIELDVEVNGIFFLVDGVKQLYGVARDITLRKKTQADLERSEAKYRRFYEMTPSLVVDVDVDNGEVLNCNPAMARSLGATPEAIVGRPISHFLPQAILEERGHYARTAVESKQTVVFADRRSGRHFQNMLIPRFEDGRRVVQTIAVETTELVHARDRIAEQEANLRVIAERAGVGITVAQDGKVAFANATAASIAGYTPARFSQLSIEDLVGRIYPEDRDRVASAYGQQVAGQSSANWASASFPTLEYRRTRPDGAIVWVECRTTGVVYRGAPALLTIHIDKTAEKEAADALATKAEQLEEALHKKDLLMRELNHRVKNNLAIVSSLIRLKDAEAGGNVDLSDIGARVDAVQTLHELLQYEENASAVRIDRYLAEVIENVFARSPVDVARRVDVAEEHIPTRTAISLGLIVNEIATNALKHGFTPGRPAVFELSMSRIGREYTLVASNSGRPVPADVDPANSATLGLRLVSTLTEQIGANLELRRTPTPAFTISFPVPESVLEPAPQRQDEEVP